VRDRHEDGPCEDTWSRGYGHRTNYSDVMETPEDIIEAIEEEPQSG
jgi:hypothetical protein